MRTSVQALLAVIMVLIVVAGIYAASSGVIDSSGDNIEDGGNESGIRMDCIFQNPRSSDSACRRDSGHEVRENNVAKI